SEFKGKKEKRNVEFFGVNKNYGQNTGTGDFEISYIPEGETIQQQIKDDYNYKKGTIDVTITSISEIFIEEGNEEPNILLKTTLDDQEGETNKTTNVNGSADINEQFSFEFVPEETTWRHIRVELWDGDEIQVGAVEIPV
ncbi:MAG: hypothetical protein EZS28_052091, partial [Streblomastix strix]